MTKRTFKPAPVSRDPATRAVRSMPAASQAGFSERQFGDVSLRLGSPVTPDGLLRLQRTLGNRAVVSLLGFDRESGVTGPPDRPTPPPVSVQRWEAQVVTRRTTMRADVKGSPDPDQKVGHTIWDGNVVKTDGPYASAAGRRWIKADFGGSEGWIRTDKLRDPSSSGERVVEGVMALRGGAGLVGDRLRPGWYLEELKVLPKARYLEEWRRNTTAGEDKAGEAFTHPVTGKTYIREDTLTKGTIFHEMLHKASGNALKAAAGYGADEGSTEYVRLNIQPAGLGIVHPNYMQFYQAIKELGDASDAAKKAIFDAYFKGELDDLKKLINDRVNAKTKDAYAAGIQKGSYGRAKEYLTADDPTAFDVWCALSKAKYGAAMYSLVIGI
jgi:hypothetical protein